MSFRLVDSGWERELGAGAAADSSFLRVVCPFIKRRALDRLLKASRPAALQVITRFDLAGFAAGVSDLAALRLLLDHGAQVRGVRNLHAKLYLFGASQAIVTSANLTDAALQRNHELGCVTTDATTVEECREYFEKRWKRAGSDLTRERLAEWETRVAEYLATGGRPDLGAGLGDEGVDAGAESEAPSPLTWVAEAPQFFVKFLGEGQNRAPLDFPTFAEVQRAGCHWAVAYPASKRPTGVEDGALIFVGRLTEGPDDIRIFGRSIGMRHVRRRDDATPEDIALRSWKQTWPRYIRVHHAEFVSGTMRNGVSLNELMETWGSQSFVPTARNAARGEGNTNPRTAYRQQAAVELTDQAAAWLTDRLEAAFVAHGMVPPAEVAALDWPEVPKAWGEVRA